jgi:hypothetical protein
MALGPPTEPEEIANAIGFPPSDEIRVSTNADLRVTAGAYWQ